MAQKKIALENIAGVECRHVVYIPPAENNGKDYHFVKEQIHLKTGEVVPNIRLISDWKRTFWVTKEGYRKHKDKKEWELKDRVKEFKSTESQLTKNVLRALDTPWVNGGIRKISRSPYLYGTDIMSTAAVKQEVYRNKWPELNTKSTIGCCDTETSMKTGFIIMATLSFKDRVCTYIDKSFLSKITDPIPKLRAALTTYLGDVVEARGIKWDVELVDSDAMVVIKTIQAAHKWSPDFMAFWNMDFDINKMIQSLERARIDPAMVFSDPSLPEQYRYFNYKQGTSQKVTASGKVTPVPPQARWHTVSTPASFYVIDAMCCYKQVRVGKPEERSYSLDAILEKHLKRGKLKFKEADGLTKAEWHIFMQENYPIEYVIYNVFDCVGMELLDEKTLDLSVSVPSGAAMSDYSRFNSQPRRLCDKLHYFVQKHGSVIGTTSDQMAGELDAKTISLSGWITMLPAHLVADNGLQIIEECPDLKSNIRSSVGDLDVRASYPWGEVVFNISKETTKKELVSIDGVSEYVRRMQGINLSGGATNSVEFCSAMFGMPSLDKMLEAFVRKDTFDNIVESYESIGVVEEAALPADEVDDFENMEFSD